MTNLERAYAADIRIALPTRIIRRRASRSITEELAADGVVYEKDGVRVTAFEVNHGDEIKPAYGYRIDYKGRSIVISGDTRFNENVIKYGTGADVLVHEVAAVRPELLKDQQVSASWRTTRPRRRRAPCSAAHTRNSPSTRISRFSRGHQSLLSQSPKS